MPRFHQLVDVWVDAETEDKANDVFADFVTGGDMAVQDGAKESRYSNPPNLIYLTEPIDTDEEA